MRLRVRIAGAAALIAVALLAGCVNLGGGKPPAQLMALTADDVVAQDVMAGGVVTNGAPADAITVLEPDAPRELAVVRVPVRLDGSTIAYLKGAQWVDRPSRLLRDLIAETLRVRHHLVIEDENGAPHGGVRLTGRLEAMGYDARAHAVVVRFDALRVAGDGTVISRRFEATEPNVAPDAAAVAPALNRAANSVAHAVAGWIG